MNMLLEKNYSLLLLPVMPFCCEISTSERANLMYAHSECLLLLTSTLLWDTVVTQVYKVQRIRFWVHISILLMTKTTVSGRI